MPVAGGVSVDSLNFVTYGFSSSDIESELWVGRASSSLAVLDVHLRKLGAPVRELYFQLVHLGRERRGGQELN